MVPVYFSRTRKSIPLILLIWLCPSFNSFANNGVDAYEFIAGASDQELPAHALSGQGFHVRSNPKAIDHRLITFRMPDGRARVAKRKRIVSSEQGRSWVGQFEGASGGIIVLSRRKGVVTGIIDDGKTLYELLPGRSGQSILFQVDESSLPPEAEPILLAPDSMTTEQSSEGSVAMAEAGNVQDIMLIYTAAVRSSYGGTDTTESALLDAVIATNQAYIDSQVDIQLNVVHIAEINYSETGDLGVTASRLRATNDSHMDEVHAWRNTYGADIVAMISTDSNYCGQGYLMFNDSSSYASSAFSVTNKSCISNATLSHEIGHNQGNCHNREESNCQSPAYPYGFGLCAPTFRTVMSYPSPCGESRIWQFSNPNVSIDGYPTGIDHNVDPAKSADSARNMNNTASTIAAYRQGAATPPQAPGNLNASPVSDDQINLQWTDNSSDESGFQLEQSTDGANWNAIATVSAGASTYADNGLTASTTYYYRVRAYNSGGSSNWSNTASSQTLLAPLPPSSPNPLSATAVSGNRVDLAWTNVGNENGYRLERSPDGSAYTLIANPSADENVYNDTDLAPNTTYYYRVMAFNGGGESAAANASVKTHAFIVHSPVAEYSTYGSIAGSHSNLGSNDDITETLAEVQSGGKRNRRHSRLEHRWEFNLSAGTSAVLLANAWKSGTSEDNFIFEYSTDGSSYTPMFTVSSTDSANEQSALLPSGVGGTLYVRVTDTDRQSGHSNIESVHVDQLVVRVDGGDTGAPSATPGNLNATPMSSNQVSLSWTDLSDNEIGFEVERSADGGSWQKLGNAPTNATAYQDNATVGGTRYDYRVRSYNAAGASSWHGPVATQTPAGIDLVADGRKIKGAKYVDLTWAGGSGQPLLIYRGSSLIDTVSGSSSSYTDSTLPRGGGSYSYQVCESGELTICSNAVTVF